MLSHLDESLLHQTPWPFRMAGLSDHRFFDRYWFEALDPSGNLAMIAGMGLYKNTGVLDGYLSVQHAHQQHNLRWSRAIGDTVNDLTLGSMKVDIIEPFKRFRLSVAPNDAGLACDLEWRSDFPPYVEAHHLMYPQHRIGTDSTRYDQAGHWTGWVEVAGHRTELNNWWGARDHSWGVRPGVGGFEPVPGRRSGRGYLFVWNCIATEDYMVQFQLQESAEGKRLYFDGQLDHTVSSGKPSVRAVDVIHDIEFIPGTRAYSRAHYVLTLEDGRTLHIEAEPFYTAWAYGGTGYDNGYDDRKGLGAWRGDIVEHDVYDLPDPESVLMNGAPTAPGHREQPAKVLVDGRPCIGHCPVMPWGAVDKYGLA